MLFGAGAAVNAGTRGALFGGEYLAKQSVRAYNLGKFGPTKGSAVNAMLDGLNGVGEFSVGGLPKAMVLPYAQGSTAKLSKLGRSTGENSILSPSALSPTHNITMGQNKIGQFINKIESQGIKETIKFVEHEGINYVVDCHHRLYAARKLKMTHVPVEKVTLPYKGYKSIADLTYTMY